MNILCNKKVLSKFIQIKWFIYSIVIHLYKKMYRSSQPDKFKVMKRVKMAVVCKLSFPSGHFPDRIRNV